MSFHFYSCLLLRTCFLFLSLSALLILVLVYDFVPLVILFVLFSFGIMVLRETGAI